MEVKGERPSIEEKVVGQAPKEGGAAAHVMAGGKEEMSRGEWVVM
jgi:hypothetical protein